MGRALLHATLSQLTRDNTPATCRLRPLLIRHSLLNILLFKFRMAEGGEDYYSSSDDDSDDSLFDSDDDDDGADCGRTLCCCRERFQRPMQALMSCHLRLCLSLGFLLTPLVTEGESCPILTFH